MPAKIKRTYRIEVQDLHDLQENIETLLGVKIELGAEFRLLADGRTQALHAMVWLVHPNEDPSRRIADYKRRALPKDNVDIVQVYYDLMWDLVQEMQLTIPF